MSFVPSIKGSIFGLAVEEVSKLVDSGAVRRAELVRRLEPGDLEILDSETNAAEWYDIRVYARFVELLRDVEGGGSDDYLRRRGARSAERLIDTGIYVQLNYLHRLKVGDSSDPHERYKLFGHDLRLLCSLSRSIYNFTSWDAKPDPDFDDRHQIEISDAASFPDVFCPHIEGFINRMVGEAGIDDIFVFVRERPELILLKMTRAI